ncbi:MAG: zf-TFIIB domain-containing protein [Bacteriovoracaceae bacterium]|nr:zf-TFIIB domain-containing protein [Bacteriovoracaceae bacterium]
MECPKCAGELNIQTYEGIEIDRCSSCDGTWLDRGELTKIIETKEETFSEGLIQETLTTACAGVPKDEIRTLVKCPKCSKAMTAVNYDYSSGIIIDSCPEGHGVWLDKDELKKVQLHREHWEKEASEHQSEWLALANMAKEDRINTIEEIKKRDMRPTKHVVGSLLKKLSNLF